MKGRGGWFVGTVGDVGETRQHAGDRNAQEGHPRGDGGSCEPGERAAQSPPTPRKRRHTHTHATAQRLQPRNGRQLPEALSRRRAAPHLGEDSERAGWKSGRSSHSHLGLPTTPRTRARMHAMRGCSTVKGRPPPHAQPHQQQPVRRTQRRPFPPPGPHPEKTRFRGGPPPPEEDDG